MTLVQCKIIIVLYFLIRFFFQIFQLKLVSVILQSGFVCFSLVSISLKMFSMLFFFILTVVADLI